MEEETWKRISEDTCYYVSSLGRIKNKKGKILKQYKRKGYCKIKIKLYDSIGIKGYFVHRLVALSFLSNIPNKNEVHHRNRKRDDNRVENLEWVSRSGNMEYVFGTMISLNRVLDIYDKYNGVPTDEFIKLLIQ